MYLKELFENKSLKPKEKTEQLSSWLLNGKISANQLIDFAVTAKDPVKASCMEALEFATKQTPEIADTQCLEFAVTGLASKAPRVKWESARVIGNICSRFPGELTEAVNGLLANTAHEGTVVRWSAAYALGEILKLNTPLNKKLRPQIEKIIDAEEKNSIKKIYLTALSKLK